VTAAVQLSEQLGAELAGIDPAEPIDEAVRSEIVAALQVHHVLLFRKQGLTPAQHVAFSRCVGPVETYPAEMTLPDHPEVVVLSSAQYTATHYWHTDGLSRRKPSSVTLLCPRQLPDEGGDTLFVDSWLAYDTLPDELQRRLEGLRMVYSADGEITHPMVRTHPVTGRKALYLDLMIYRGRIVGMRSREKEELLRALRDHVERPGAIYRHRWRMGDLMMWDNASVLHRAADAEPAQLRVLHRTTTEGTEPC
jgi:taurine dioxygenase